MNMFSGGECNIKINNTNKKQVRKFFHRHSLNLNTKTKMIQLQLKRRAMTIVQDILNFQIKFDKERFF